MGEFIRNHYVNTINLNRNISWSYNKVHYDTVNSAMSNCRIPLRPQYKPSWNGRIGRVPSYIHKINTCSNVFIRMVWPTYELQKIEFIRVPTIGDLCLKCRNASNDVPHLFNCPADPTWPSTFLLVDTPHWTPLMICHLFNMPSSAFILVDCGHMQNKQQRS